MGNEGSGYAQKRGDQLGKSRPDGREDRKIREKGRGQKLYQAKRRQKMRKKQKKKKSKN